MVAPHRKIKTLGEGILAAFDLTHPPPVDRQRIIVLLGAGHLAAVASDALRHVEVKPVLLAGSRPDSKITFFGSLDEQ